MGCVDTLSSCKECLGLLHSSQLHMIATISFQVQKPGHMDNVEVFWSLAAGGSRQQKYAPSSVEARSRTTALARELGEQGEQAPHQAHYSNTERNLYSPSFPHMKISICYLGI